MKKKIHAFTLAEALILLLIAALLAAALVPVITRKHKDVGEHGEWICTINSNGQHVVKTTYRGKVSQFEVASNGGDHCVFSPPANAKNFTIKAVGGGGGGGGGASGVTETVFDSRIADGENQVFAGSIDTDGAYSIIYAGGGGGGGGMACGEASKQFYAKSTFTLNNATLFLNETPSSDRGGYGASINSAAKWDYTNQRYYGKDKLPAPPNCTVVSDAGLISCNIQSPDAVPSPKRHYQYGYVDQPIPNFDYDLLIQNDKKFTDKHNYGKTDYSVKIYDAKGNAKTVKSLYDVKYNYIQVGSISDNNALSKRAFCFAEDWDMSKSVDGDVGLYLSDKSASKPSIKCWNLPGIGGRAADIVTQPQNVELHAGQSIYATVGQGGSGNISGQSDHKVHAYLLAGETALSLQEKKAYLGDDGSAGGDTIIDYGTGRKVIKGAAGGASRQLAKVNFINIPVYECAVEPVVSTSVPNSKGCPSGWHESSSSCTSTPGCKATYGCEYYKDVPVYDEEGNDTGKTEKQCGNYAYKCSVNGYHEEINKYDVTSNCVVAIRPQYFTKMQQINACIYSSDIPEDHEYYHDFTKLDYPFFNKPIKEYIPGVDASDDGETENDIEVVTLQGRTKYTGNPGSGGYGAGELTRNYIKNTGETENFARFEGSKGTDGFVAIYKSDAYGGTGGQAGQYISTMVKKVGKLEITIGTPGKGGTSSQNGMSGKATTIKESSTNENMFVLQGGMGGQGKRLNVVGPHGLVSGGDGASSPVENEANRAKIIPLGGGSGNNASVRGQTAAIGEIWGLPTMSGISLNYKQGSSWGTVFLNLVGRHPLDMTYGAGGGGGGGGENTWGEGGCGTPGAVIIKW